MTQPITLPWPPSVNHYYRRVGARTLVSAAGRAYRTNVFAALVAQGVRVTPGRLAVSIDAHPPDRRERDLDNLLKALLDALQHGGAYESDSQIDHLTLARCRVVGGGRVIVRIREVLH